MNKNGKAFLNFLILLLLIAGIGYVIYTNKDFQRTHKKEITKINFYLRDYIKAYKDFTKDFYEKVAEWKKSHPSKQKAIPGEKPLETWTFEEMIFNAETLEREMPPEMVKHQNDEITVCSFNADLIINNPLTDKEIIHLANIMRFCGVSAITNLRNESSLKRISTALKILRYNAVYQTVAGTGSAAKTFYAYLYRDDRIQPVQKAELYKGDVPLPVTPAYGIFKAGDFDFIIANFATPSSGIPLDSLLVLEKFSEAIKNEFSDTQDLLIFGDFAFESRGIIWDSSSLLPNIARTLPADRAPLDLLGDFWFRKNDLIEFNGRSGVINLNSQSFPSKSKPPLTANKPLWTQFKLLPDDDQ